MVRLVFTMILLVLLTNCGSVSLVPSSELVQKAIALQLEQTQQQLSQKLDIEFRGFDIKRLSITQEKPLTIQNLLSYKVQGTYDLVLKLPKQRNLTQPQKAFEVYLQLQRERKTWRLLYPEQGSQNTQAIWRSYLIE
ncbi:hypothetical protein [Cylindrospermum sp. FACHB-282]|uniref:hypothetical protein n=1 Tax=Cylindrospermum sp. FACHB-282 TaxID=2692794 RepID=UPI001685B74F|nr:hypothetical protein [Cylindrospermum sp. FACHB-282]MBD2384129.1 hypothetical protein [Cylindrospermum sp. FACHB-282]